MSQKKIIVSVINDLVTDQRVARTCSVFTELNYEVLLIGRKKRDSPTLEKRNYSCKRLVLVFEQGPLFYLFFNLRLFFVLLFHKADVLFSNDLDTLLPNYLVSKLKSIPLIYDSHEIFCEVPELKNNPAKKQIWEKLEKWIVPKLRYTMTVNESIANYFNEKYSSRFIFLRNIPDFIKPEKLKSREELGLPVNKKIILLQGAGINVERGAEELVKSFQYVSDNYLLLIIGSGDVIHLLKEDVIKLKLHDKVKFIDKLPATQLIHYTMNADLGVSIDKDSNMNYHFSLPNKLFDYMHAGIPIMASHLPEIENFVNDYHVGFFIESHEPKHIADQLVQFINSSDYLVCKANTQKAVLENNWLTEKQKLIDLISSLNF